MNTKDLCEIKFGLECIQIVDNKFLERCDGSTCDDIEQMCILKLENEYVSFFGNRSLSKESYWLERMFLSDEFSQNTIKTIELRRELWYWFEHSTEIQFPLVTELGDTEDTLDTFAILENGDWISRAWSVRRNNRGAEIAVETKESHRRKGYGSQVVSAWAKSQIQKGKIGIYAHRKYNLESKYLAEKMGVSLFADVLSLQ